MILWHKCRGATTRRAVASLALAVAIAGFDAPSPALAQDNGDTAEPQRNTSRPYDKELFQLAEVLGAVHYLRTLCGADEGQKWRDQMRGLVEAEGSPAIRRAQLVRSFNKGYRGYGRTYQRCTDLARRSVERLLREGRTLSKRILETAG